MRKRLWTIIFLICIGLSACTLNQEENFAPVGDISLIEPIPKKGVHQVLPGETLYSIAWRYGLDYSDLAKRNRIAPPYAIHTGQMIYLNKNKPEVKITKIKKTKKETSKPITAPPSPIQVKVPTPEQSIATTEPTRAVSAWQWPAKGPVIGKFSSLNKGINIGGHLGDPVYATAAGKVVYSGHGLRGYGNLIIIKHNRTFLTAYAHNSQILVKNGAWVKSGQQVAEMGNTDSRRTMLHFEIRRHGQPVNPLIYLNQKI